MDPILPGGNRGTVRWLLVDPVGWFVLQVAMLFLAGVIGRVIVSAAGGDVSSGAQWAMYAVLLIAMGLVIYRIRKRYLADHPEEDDSITGLR